MLGEADTESKTNSSSQGKPKKKKLLSYREQLCVKAAYLRAVKSVLLMAIMGLYCGPKQQPEVLYENRCS